MRAAGDAADERRAALGTAGDRAAEQQTPRRKLPANGPYRGSGQDLPGRPTSSEPSGCSAPPKNPTNPRKTAASPAGPLPPPRTGAPNKLYRGPRQAVPGRRTKSAGAHGKYYRGPRQVVPGRPANTTGAPGKRLPKTCCKRPCFYQSRASYCSCFLCNVMLLNNHREDLSEDGEGNPWARRTSS